MNEDNVFIIAVLLFLFSLVAAVAVTVIHGDYKVTEMVKNGTPPLEARCAISPANGICDLVAAKANE